MVQKWDNMDAEIILRLLKGETHLRQLSKELSIPHTTLSRRLHALRDGMIVDYSHEGRNCVYGLKRNLLSLKAVESAEHYKLAKTVRKYRFLLPVFESLMREGGLVVLFGSYAKGTAKEDSDIDVYMETRESRVKQRAESIYGKLSVKIGVFDTSDPLIREIMKHHVIIRGVEEYYERIGFLAEAQAGGQARARRTFT